LAQWIAKSRCISPLDKACMKKSAAAPLFLLLLSLLSAPCRAQSPDNAAIRTLWESNTIFCKNCHGKAGEGAFGPDLAGRGLSPAQFRQAVRMPWGVMPAFPESEISDAELDALASWFANLPKVAEPGRWLIPVGADKPHAQQLFASAGCAQCHGPIPPPNFDGLVKEFDLLKTLVYSHTTAMPKLEPPKPGSRLAMGNFNPLRLPEAELREIFDWATAPRH
jgi:mono/diheme cytochrome c family protein